MIKDIKNILVKIILIIIIFGALYAINYYESNQEKINYREETIKLPANDKLKVYFIDVGEADSILINSNNEFALIDGGNNKDGKKLVNYFESLGINSFKYIFATHAHEDHIGGLDYIIRSFNVENFYIPNIKVDNMTYEDIVEATKEKNIEMKEPTIDDTLILGNSQIRILYVGHDKIDLNNSSIILKLLYGNNSYLFMADAPNDIEREIINKNIQSDVLKVGHHGSAYSTSANFLYKVHPQYAVISVGNNNDYGFPKKVTLDKLERVGATIYRTDIDGTIISTSNGENITFETIKTDTNGA